MTITSFPAASTPKPARRGWYWLPRGLGLGFALFVSLFALDIFDLRLGFWETLVGLAMHLIPTAILVVVLALAWRWDWVGGVAYPLLGALYLWQARGLPWTNHLTLAGPLVVIGLLFWANWLSQRRRRPGLGGEAHR